MTNALKIRCVMLWLFLLGPAAVQGVNPKIRISQYRHTRTVIPFDFLVAIRSHFKGPGYLDIGGNSENE